MAKRQQAGDKIEPSPGSRPAISFAVARAPREEARALLHFLSLFWGPLAVAFASIQFVCLHCFGSHCAACRQWNEMERNRGQRDPIEEPPSIRLARVSAGPARASLNIKRLLGQDLGSRFEDTCCSSSSRYLTKSRRFRTRYCGHH